MNERKSILLLMFDLPAKTGEDHREYYHFMKKLRCTGFLQLQESCYLKLIRNVSSVEAEMKSLNGIMPAKGNVSILPLSVGQFRGMKCFLGEPFDMDLFTEDVVFIGKPEENDEGGNGFASGANESSSADETETCMGNGEETA